MLNNRLCLKPYPWQELMWEQTVSQCKTHVPHAFLFIGPEGIGKKNFAQVLARWLLCETKLSSNRPLSCGQCQSCVWMNSETHPDFFQIAPLSETSSVIKIEQIRSLIDHLSQTSMHGNGQVVLIEPVEGMTMSSMNALLKTLEEPQGAVVFILITHQPYQIPLTLKSRTQAVYFALPETGLSKAWLKTHASSGDTDLLLSIAGGLPLKALVLSQEEAFLKERDFLFEQLVQLTERKIYPIQAAESCLKLDFAFLLKNLISITIDLMRVTMEVDVGYLVHQDKIQLFFKFVQAISIRSLIYYQHQLRETLREYRDHPTLNRSLLLEYLFIQWRRACS